MIAVLMMGGLVLGLAGWLMYTKDKANSAVVIKDDASCGSEITSKEGQGQ